MDRPSNPPLMNPALAAPAPRNVCRIACQGCGASAAIELEALRPTAMKLRCLSCGSGHVLVAPSRVADYPYAS